MNELLDFQNWYLVYTKPRQEEFAKQHLDNQGYKTLLPKIQREKILRGKRTILDEALFPRYLFIQLPDGKDFSPIRSTRGCAGLVRFGNSLPKAIPNQIMVNLFKYLEEKKSVEEYISAFQLGDLVSIEQGAFKGLPAIFLEPDGERRSILLIKLIGQDIQIPMDNKGFRAIQTA